MRRCDPRKVVDLVWGKNILGFRHHAAAAVCGLLSACVGPYGTGPFGAGDLQSARAACNQAYPRRIGNYLPHAHCVNAAVEAHALPAARYPDLIRLQEEVRTTLSEKVDRRRLSVRDGERQMAEADKLVTEAEHERDAQHPAAASRRIATVEAMLR
jgi:hypothetical protein